MSTRVAESNGAADSEPRRSQEQQEVKPRRKLYKRLAWGAAIGVPVAIGALWIAVHSIPWMGPLVANTLRAIIGKENVTRLEEFAYSVEDRVNRTLKADSEPKAYWDVPARDTEQAPAAPPPMGQAGAQAQEAEGEKEKELPVFRPEDVGPVHESWSAAGDGQWVPITDPRRPEEPARLYKTLLHPDKSRSWAELFVVAVDLRQVAVMPVMGYQEPRTDKEELQDYPRYAKIPKEHWDAMLAAFNGGFMAEHGQYGVYFDGVTFIEPQDEACTFARYEDGSFEIATWSKIKDEFDDMLWYRQAPNCMYEDGEMHPKLKIHRAKKWGATLDGRTVIRRSAVGLSPDRQTLYVGISNHTNAKVMALGMHHAGSEDVAQMDVNWSYPKFVTYEPNEKGRLEPVALAEGFEFSKDLYLRERSMRDFYYLAREEEVEAEKPDGKPDWP